MRPPSSLSEGPPLIVVDASTVINLNATGVAGEVLLALPHKIIVPEVVLFELENGCDKGRTDFDLAKLLIANEVIVVAPLDESGLQTFEELTVGDAAQTLDDGEAATIACAVSMNAVAVIDEKKAISLCSERFSLLPIASTLDVLAHPNVQEALGAERLADAIFDALQVARMRIVPDYLEWAVTLIGNERAALCASLPRSFRVLQVK